MRPAPTCGPALVLSISVCAAAEQDSWVLGMAELHRIDRLAVLRRSVAVASISSYDRSGGNDDGFSGKYSCVRKESDGLVIADLSGPGIIYRIWTPTPTEDPVEFYFDGETAPRIRVKFRDLFTGRHPPFISPIVGFGAGGYYSYVPLPYARSCKVLVRAQRVQFYQINFATYPADAPVRTFEPTPTAEYLEHQNKACSLLGAAGTDLSAYAAPPDTRILLAARTASLAPGQSVTLFESNQPGRIVGLRLAPAEALATRARDLVLRIFWDADPSPAVECPAGDFFGYAWGEPAARGLLVGTSNGVCYSYWPMPYDRSAKVELVSQRRTGPPVQLRAEVVHAPAGRRPDEGRFYALWRRENPTTPGKPFTFLETRGRGHLVGCILQCQGTESGQTLYFEGDDQTTIDGRPVIHGTGSEDFFNGGWYDVPGRWEKRLCFPLSGCLDYKKPLGRTGAYRFMIGDAYAYRDSILQTIEHGGTDNSVQGDYVGVTYFYSKDRPTCDLSLPPPASRAVTDPKRIAFALWWAQPIHAWTFDGATLVRKSEKLEGKDVRSLSMTAVRPADWFGPPFVSFMCELPAAGLYSVAIETIKGPGQGIVQLFRNDVPAGEPADLYASQRAKAEVRLGRLYLEEGRNDLMLKLVGRNEKATGLAVDLITLTCERQDEPAAAAP